MAACPRALICSVQCLVRAFQLRGSGSDPAVTGALVRAVKGRDVYLFND